MIVLKNNPWMSVVARVAACVAMAVLFTGCPPKRGNAVSGPGTARPVEPGTGYGTAPGGSDVGSMQPDGGTGYNMDSPSPLADVNFEYDSAALTPAAMEILQRHALWFKDHPGVRATLQGHCDERGTVEYNLALGEQRSRAVYDYLTSVGVPGTRLSTMSFGKERPLVMGSGEESWAKNRRVHFDISG